MSARRQPALRWLPLLGIGAVAAWLYLWQLGSSSFFVDEVASMRLAAEPLGDLLPRLRVAENSPAGYFALLHLWTGIFGSEAEWVARLPSALAAVAVVIAVWRLGALVDGQRAGLVAALLAAVSPLVLQYAQQARPYALAMLALALAGIGVVEAERRGSSRWLAVGAIGCVGALSLHYAALAVVAPMCAWVLFRRAAPLRARVLFCGASAVVWLAWLPLALLQRSDHPTSQLGPYGTFTRGHLVRVAAAPFDDRYTVEVDVLKALTAAAVLAALAAVALQAWRERHAALGLMLLLVAVPAAALVVASLAGIEILNSRYMTFATPFMLVGLGSAVARARAPLAAGLLGLLLVSAVVYTAGSHQQSGFYPDTRGAVETIDRGWQAGDAVLHDSSLGISFPLAYYAEQRLPPRTRVLPLGPRANAKRLWIVREIGMTRLPLDAVPHRYRAVVLRRFPASVDVTVTLARAR